ncbi:MAG TPA: pyridoxal phosphate-dependent aminotransferase [Candidatus Merdenecus merdavium]|nr:pyridoxal phosphate-dependent aminotransferase [Candidatus Merdenecus merdavium]
MISEKMKGHIEAGSAIRVMFEEGKRLAQIYGPENVYDFSLGNPNVKAPDKVKKTIMDILEKEESTVVHGYMNNSGYEDVRQRVADHLNDKYGTSLDQGNILMTVGAAGGLNVMFKTLLDPGDEVIVFAPYFGEYKNYVDNYDGVLVTVPPNPPTFLPDLEAFRSSITRKTKIVILNTPNNPTGVIYSEDTIKELTKILKEKEEELQRSIYIVSDEPYRELVYEHQHIPYITKYYHNAIVGYSYSKSLSLPGERIGYLVLPKELDSYEDIVKAANVANRILGFVNAPSLFQKVVAECLDEEVDVTYYKRNRDKIYQGLSDLGFECVKPQGAFYLFLKSPMEDEKEFCKLAKEHRILLVQGSSFGCPGYVRLAYCVSYETIIASLPQFEKLAKKVFHK